MGQVGPGLVGSWKPAQGRGAACLRALHLLGLWSSHMVPEPQFPHLDACGKAWAFPMAQWVKNPPAMQETQETWVRSLGWEDPLEEEIAACCVILAWKIPRTEEPGGLQSTGSQRIKYDQATEHKITEISDIIQYFFAYFLHSFSDLSLKLSKAFFLF